MNAFSVVFDVAVALTRGATLRAAEEKREAWGVIDCSQALGAFDARSDAWCGRDGVPHRMTREAAEEWARRLSGSSHDGTVYAALEIPARPLRVAAGRHCLAVSDSLTFEVVDWSGGPADVTAVGSAFDAARSFVALAGERLAYAALAEVCASADR